MKPVERYLIRAKHEWAYIYIDEATGVFTCYSSFGTYGYCWQHRGNATLKEFLVDLEFDYFMGKTRPSYMRYDNDATVDGIKHFIIEQRRLGALSQEGARDVWNDLLHARDGDMRNEFWQYESLMKLYGSDYFDIFLDRPDGDSKGFWKKIWPEFLKQVAIEQSLVTS